MKNILFILGIIFILAVVIFLYKQQLPLNNSDSFDESNNEQKLNDDVADKIEDKENKLQTYTNSMASFSVKYPGNAVLQGTLDDDLSISIVATQIDDLEYPGFGKEEALKNIDALNKGEYGEEFDWPLESSKKVTKVGDSNGQEFMVLGRFEVCDVVFERKLIFYNNDYQIEITLRGDKDKIVESMLSYFKVDNLNCQDEKIWDFDKQDEFYQKLSQGQGSDISQYWFDSFDEIIKTIEFIKPVIDIGLIQGEWKSLDDENSIIEFKDKIKIDFYKKKKCHKETFEFKQDDQRLVVTDNSDTFEYTIDELTDNSWF